MSIWPFRKKRTIPSYSLLDAEPCRGIPKELSDREASDDFKATVDRIRTELLTQPHDLDAENFAIFLAFGEGLLQIQVPEGKCLLVFSASARAADYIRVQVPDLADQLGFFGSTPRNSVKVIQHFTEYAGIDLVALDRCPRCNIFATLNPDAMDKPETLIGAWAISVSSGATFESTFPCVMTTPFGSAVVPEVKTICRMSSGVRAVCASARHEGSWLWPPRFVESSSKVRAGIAKLLFAKSAACCPDATKSLASTWFATRDAKSSEAASSIGTITTPRNAHPKNAPTHCAPLGPQSMTRSPLVILRESSSCPKRQAMVRISPYVNDSVR